MKKITFAIALLLMTFGSTIAQKTLTAEPSIKQVRVTAQTVAPRPGNKAYTLDLTRRGTIYNLAPGIDYSRVRIRTAKGEMTMTELIQKSGKSISGSLRVGMTKDIRTQRPGLSSRPGGGRLNFSCENLVCVCTGDRDCNDLFTSDLCGDIAICYPDGCVCLRF